MVPTFTGDYIFMGDDRDGRTLALLVARETVTKSREIGLEVVTSS